MTYYQSSRYRYIVAFLTDMIEFMTDEELLMLEYFGYGNNKNPYGMVRDHKYSVGNGLANGVFPSIMRHPRNMKLIANNDNGRKGMSNSISLEDLFEEIIDFNREWPEQEECINDINRYRNGERCSNDFEKLIEELNDIRNKFFKWKLNKIITGRRINHKISIS